MAGSVNKVILIGNVGKDPEIRSTQGGKKIATLRIATSDTWRDKSTNERRERTEWHTVVIFNEGLAGVVEKYVRKGSKLFVEGALQTRKWQDQQGNDRYATEVVLQPFNGSLAILDTRKQEGGNDHGYMRDDQPKQPSRSAPQSNGGGFGGGGFDDEIPFAPEVR